MRAVVIGSRGSALSRRQTEQVLRQLQQCFPDRAFELRTITADADRRPDVPLVAMGGEGVFVKELEDALQRREIDCAVHSLKDLPTAIGQGLTIAAIPEREDARDALISRGGQALKALPEGARIGTSSPRRRSQLLRQRSDLRMLEIRGNVDTRLRKLDDGQYDAIALAACGLIRLGLDARITQRLEFDVMLPEPGQGALAIETRADDAEMIEIARALEHAATRACVEAERAVLAALGGGCRVPIAAHAEQRPDGLLYLDAAVTALDGSRQVRDAADGSLSEPERLGRELADRLRRAGAEDLLR